MITMVKNDNVGGGGGYDPYKPAMLPIFGTYDDYGGMEDIEENRFNYINKLTSSKIGTME